MDLDGNGSQIVNVIIIVLVSFEIISTFGFIFEKSSIIKI